MGSPECIRSGVRRDKEDSSEGKSGRPRDNEQRESNEKRKHRSSKLRKPLNGEEAEGSDTSGRKGSTGEKTESRKRSGGSSRAGSDEDDSDAIKESRSRQIRKNQDGSSLEKLSSWYQDGELKNKHEGVDRSGNRLHSRADGSDRKKSTSKFSDYESSQSRKKGKDDQSYDRELEKPLDKDFRYSERRESSRERGHGSSEQHKSSRKRLDESDAVTRAEQTGHIEKNNGRSEKFSDHKNENVRDRSVPEKVDLSESKSRGLDLHSDRGMKYCEREDRRVDSDRSKGESRSEAPEEDNKGCFWVRDDKSGKEGDDESRQQRNSIFRDVVESRERVFYAEEDSNTWMIERSRRELDLSNRSRSPDRNAQRFNEPENFGTDYDRSSSFRRKELDMDVYRDDRSKGRDDGWSDRRRDWEGSKDNWKRWLISGNDKEAKDGDMAYDHGREWEVQRRGRDRIDNERPYGRSGGRKDGSRTEAVKTSSNYGISNENYDVIEIQTKPFEYGREESGSTFARRTEGGQQSDPKLAPNNEWPYPREDRMRKNDLYGSGKSIDDSKDRYVDDCVSMRDSDSFRDDTDFQGGKRMGQKGIISNRAAGGLSSSSGSQAPYGNQELGSFGRAVPQGVKGGRMGRGGRGRPLGRDPQQVGPLLPMMGSPFGPLGMPPPGPMQPLAPSMSPAPGPPISPGIFITPFAPPVWPGARGVEMNMLAVPPSLSPVPPGSSGPRFSPNIGTPPNPALFFNQPGPGRGAPLSPNFNAVVSAGRGQAQDKSPGGWIPPRSNLPHGKAPSRGEQNDYSQNFVDTGMRPQNFVRELELTSVVEDYPKLRELIQKKDEIVANSNSAPMYYKCDLREQVLSPEFFGTKFDVILVDPPWEEFVHRAPGVTDHMESWTFEEIMNLKIEAIADTPSFIFLWVGDGVGLEQGRQCLKKWGFRRCEDICWVKTNKSNATPGLRHDSHTLFQRSKEHCLMGIKGTVRRSTDGHIIHANIDTDVIIAEEPPYGSTAKPEDMYRIVEHFSLGRRRLELFGEDHNIRAGWLTAGKGLSSSNFNAEAYVRNFTDTDGKVWQGGSGRNPPPEAPHLVLTTPDIEALRPKSPMKNQQQQLASISLTTDNSSNKRTTVNSPQIYNSQNQEASSSDAAPLPWPSPLDNFQGREGSNMVSYDRAFDMYRFNGPFGPANAEYLDFESHRTMNML